MTNSIKLFLIQVILLIVSSADSSAQDQSLNGQYTYITIDSVKIEDRKMIMTRSIYEFFSEPYYNDYFFEYEIERINEHEIKIELKNAKITSGRKIYDGVKIDPKDRNPIRKGKYNLKIEDNGDLQLVNIENCHERTLVKINNKINDSPIREKILGIYVLDSLSNNHLSRLSVEGYAKQIEIKNSNELESVIVVKNDGGGIKDDKGNYIDPIRKGQWRIIADTIYLQTDSSRNFEEKYLMSGDTLTSINLDIKTQWIKKTPYNNK